MSKPYNRMVILATETTNFLTAKYNLDIFSANLILLKYSIKNTEIQNATQYPNKVISIAKNSKVIGLLVFALGLAV